MNDPIAGEIIKFDNEKQQVFGWAYVTHNHEGEVVVDKSGEFVDDPEQIEKAAYDFVLTSRKGGVEHQRNDEGVISKSTLIESVVFTPEKMASMGIPPGSMPTGWWVGYAIQDDETWQRVRSGELANFSVHGSGKKEVISGS